MNPKLNDDELGPLLRKNFQVGATKNPIFRADVWARIEASRRSPNTWSAWLRLNAARCTLLAIATVTVASVGGGWIATAQAKQNREHLVQQYLASIDPHQQN